MSGHSIVVAGRAPEVVSEITAHLRAEPDLTVQSRLLINGHNNPLHGVAEKPDVLILTLTERSELELQSLIEMKQEHRIALVVVGDTSDPAILRLIMQAGGRDFLSSPTDRSELLMTVRRIIAENEIPAGRTPRITSFINTKGGCGSSVLAANFAYICQQSFGFNSLLMDLDRQFASLPQYLDMEPNASLFDSLRVVEELDASALDAFVARHASGLAVMSSHLIANEPAETPVEIDEAFALSSLLELLTQKYDRVIAEIPRYIDVLGATAIQKSDQVVLVVQQTVPCLRDAVRLKNMLINELDVPLNRLTILVNRHDAKLETSLDVVQDSLGIASLYAIPNDYENVSSSIDMGTPLSDLAPKSPTVAALRDMIRDIEGIEEHKSSSLIARSFSALIRR